METTVFFIKFSSVQKNAGQREVNSENRMHYLYKLNQRVEN